MSSSISSTVTLNTRENPAVSIQPTDFTAIGKAKNNSEEVRVQFYSTKSEQNVWFTCNIPSLRAGVWSLATAFHREPDSTFHNPLFGSHENGIGCLCGYDLPDPELKVEFEQKLKEYNVLLDNAVLFIRDCQTGKLESEKENAFKSILPGFVNLQDSGGGNALIYACFNNRPQVIALLKQLKPDLSLTTICNYTALEYCCKSSNPDCLKELLKFEDAIEQSSRNRPSYITTFAAKESPKVRHLQLLLDKGACINGQVTLHDAGVTPLMTSCMTGVKGRFKKVRFLLDSGANVALKNTRGNTALHDAEVTPLMISCMTGVKDGFKKVRFLLDSGANVALKNTRGNTALHYAIAYGQLDSANALLQAGADSTEKNFSKKTSFECLGLNMESENIITHDLPTKAKLLAQALENDYWCLAIHMFDSGWRLEELNVPRALKTKYAALQKGKDSEETTEKEIRESVLFLALKVGDIKAAEACGSSTKMLEELTAQPRLLREIKKSTSIGFIKDKLDSERRQGIADTDDVSDAEGFVMI
ncbi:hypothetical protein SOPP22_05790 [Shewanella sp. OPT22]|nr:hypothetical protein SOPP22_05790 [Shewanella sp. OPT22]